MGLPEGGGEVGAGDVAAAAVEDYEGFGGGVFGWGGHGFGFGELVVLRMGLDCW